MNSKDAHKQGVDLVCKYFRDEGFWPVLPEPKVECLSEIPDVWAMNNRGLVSVAEVKVSLSDYRADLHKYHPPDSPFRCGNDRWMAVPYGMIDEQQLADTHPSWGLMYFDLEQESVWQVSCVRGVSLPSNPTSSLLILRQYCQRLYHEGGRPKGDHRRGKNPLTNEQCESVREIVGEWGEIGASGVAHMMSIEYSRKMTGNQIVKAIPYIKGVKAVENTIPTQLTIDEDESDGKG